MKNLIVLLVLAGAGYAGYNAWKAAKEEGSEARTIKALPPSVQHTVAQMDSASQNAFFNEYEKKKKKRSVGYIIWLVCGWHYLYTKKVGFNLHSGSHSADLVSGGLQISFACLALSRAAMNRSHAMRFKHSRLEISSRTLALRHS